MMSLEDRVLSRVAPSPTPGPHSTPPATGRRPAPGRGSGEAGTLCDWVRRGCSGRTGGGGVRVLSWRPVPVDGGRGGQISAVTFLILTAKK